MPTTLPSFNLKDSPILPLALGLVTAAAGISLLVTVLYHDLPGFLYALVH